VDEKKMVEFGDSSWRAGGRSNDILIFKSLMLS
jgi:hypothetical protein